MDRGVRGDHVAVAGDDDRDDVNAMLVQPFVNYNLPDGWYLSSSPIIAENWEAGSELASLACALDAVSDNTVLIYGDLLFRTYILNNLLDWEAELLVVVDSSPLDQAPGNKNDLAYCSAPDDRAMYQQRVSLQRVSSDPAWEGRSPDGRCRRPRPASRACCPAMAGCCGGCTRSTRWRWASACSWSSPC